MLRFVLVSFIIIHQIFTFEDVPWYYWREYTGTIPADAVIGGKDSKNQNIYIGQAYVKGKGVIPGEIHPGISQVQVQMDGIQTVDKYIKILCGLQKVFVWLGTNCGRLHADLTGKIPVLGGHEDRYNTSFHYVGRAHFDTGIKIGKVNQFSDNYLYGIYNSSKFFLEGYYWREYVDGVIPKDALIGGRDNSGQYIFIGQVYVEDKGLIPAEIHPGVAEVEVEIDGIVEISKFIKILCGIEGKFNWLNTDSDHLDADMNGKIPVLGGHQDKCNAGGQQADCNGFYYIGRVNFEKRCIIGKITQFEYKEFYGVYNHTSSTPKLHEYDVLTIDNV